MRNFFEEYFENSINIKNEFINDKNVILTLEKISNLILKTVKKEKKFLLVEMVVHLVMRRI